MVTQCLTARADVRRLPRARRRVLGTVIVGAVIVAAGGSPVAAKNEFWLTNFYRSGYPTTQECARVINGPYLSVWFTQNVAYVDWGGTCNVQHALDACWLKARSVSTSNGVPTGYGAVVCNAGGTSIAQGNTTILAGDNGLSSQLWFWDMNNSAYLYGVRTGP